MSDSDNLGVFFGKVRGAGVETRLFSWKKICAAATTAEEEYAVLIDVFSKNREQLAETENTADARGDEITSLTSHLRDAKSHNKYLHGELDGLSGEKEILEERDFPR